MTVTPGKTARAARAGEALLACHAELREVLDHWAGVLAAAADADGPDPAHALSQASLEPLVRAWWTAPGGAQREGEVYAPGGARAGTTVMVWTDRSGRLEGAPAQRADVTVLEAFAAPAPLPLPRPSWWLLDSSPGVPWTGAGPPPGTPSGHAPDRNGPAGCEDWEHPRRDTSLQQVSRITRAGHLRGAAVPPRTW